MQEKSSLSSSRLASYNMANFVEAGNKRIVVIDGWGFFNRGVAVSIECEDSVLIVHARGEAYRGNYWQLQRGITFVCPRFPIFK